MAKIEFIIPTWGRPDHLMCLIGALKAQTCPDWKAVIMVDGTGPVCDLVCDPSGWFDGDIRITIDILDTRYNDWGHTPRNTGLAQASAEWVVMTGEDNYYVPTFVEEVLKVADTYVNFIYTDMVHNWSGGEYKAINCTPKTGNIDIGNSIFRTEFAKQMRLDVHDKCADGKFVEEYLRRFGGRSVRIDKLLYVHN